MAGAGRQVVRPAQESAVRPVVAHVQVGLGVNLVRMESTTNQKIQAAPRQYVQTLVNVFELIYKSAINCNETGLSVLIDITRLVGFTASFLFFVNHVG